MRDNVHVREYEGSSDRHTQEEIKYETRLCGETWRVLLSVGFLSLYKDFRDIMDKVSSLCQGDAVRLKQINVLL